eukprot:TRINITY_DN48957_c0_g1_i1.p1 TRINITY_DN48957_c0_g1~~TRINITY_DN48957_c0_g1_i1.p1  ORF type:complete len:590 (+),score=153.86 TRINITY_DN48957_c0_g1_i1:90-1772(+)
MPRSPRSPRSPLQPNIQRVSDEALCLQLQQFLDNWHFRVMNSSLGKQFSRLKVTEICLQALSMNGIPMSQNEINTLVNMEENIMIFEIIARMPEGLRERFEHLTIELQVVINTATRMRSTIESGDSDAIQALMEESSSTAFGQQTVKRAIVQASTEVAKIMRCQETWGASMASRLDRLSHAADIAEMAQKRLVALEAQVQGAAPQKIDKAKKVLISFAEQNKEVLLSAAFANWHGMYLKEKGERELRAKYEKECEEAEQMVADFKAAKLQNIRGVMMSAVIRDQQELTHAIFGAWQKCTEHSKAEAEVAKEIEKIEETLSKQSKQVAENAAKVMLSVMMGQEGGLVASCFASWVQFHEEYKKDAQFEDAVKTAEKKMEEFMEKQKEDAQKVLEHLCAGTDTGLVNNMFKAWSAYVFEGRKLRELEKQVNSAEGRFASLKCRQATTGKNVQGRVNEQIKLNCQYRFFMEWNTQTKVNRIEKYYSAKIDGKRKQLGSVQTLFQSFARDLETGLKDIDGGGDDSSRGHSHRRSKPKSHSKSEPAQAMAASVSLPDISKKQHDR